MMAVVCAVGALAGLARAADEEDKSGKRKVKIAWREVPGSSKYDFELANNPDMDPKMERKEFKNTEAPLNLKPGTYYFRIRGIDSSGAPGPWSDVQGFVVNPGPPRLVKPEDKTVFTKPIEGEKLHLTWTSGIKGSEYHLAIEDKNGVVLKRTVNETEFYWKPMEAGDYKWRVGYETPTGQEWSKYKAFTVKADAMPWLKFAAGASVVIDEEKEIREERKSEFSVIGRLAQSVAAYSSEDKDLGTQSSGAALVGVYSAEVRWRGGKNAGQKWTFSGSLNFELFKQVVLNQSFGLTKISGRLFYGKETGQWRAGPFLHYGMNKTGVFIAKSATTSRNAVVSRSAPGLGGYAVFRPAQAISLSAIFMLRMDGGSTAPEIPTPIASSMGWETGFGMVLGISPSMFLEGRLRAINESTKWEAANGKGTSFMSTTFILGDVGVGYRF